MADQSTPSVEGLLRASAPWTGVLQSRAMSIAYSPATSFNQPPQHPPTTPHTRPATSKIRTLPYQFNHHVRSHPVPDEKSHPIKPVSLCHRNRHPARRCERTLISSLAGQDKRRWPDLPRRAICKQSFYGRYDQATAFSLSAGDQRLGCDEATAPRNCVVTVNSPIFLPMSFATSFEKR